MKIMIASDIHIDINHNDKFEFLNKDVDLLLLAGDISGNYFKERAFLQELQNKNYYTCAVAGNHLGYDYYTEDDENLLILDDSLKKLCEKFKGRVNYLHNECIPFYTKDNSYTIFGGTMYSDFKLHDTQRESMQEAQCGINDFFRIRTNIDSYVRTVTPEDYIKWNISFKSKLTKCLKNTDKDVIVLTHFAPSARSIDEQYIGNSLNPYYVCNMENYILKHPQIKLWVHGHVHSNHDYYIGNCRVVCYPYGYYSENDYPSQLYEGKIIEL